jgi:hypothetical protein
LFRTIVEHLGALVSGTASARAVSARDHAGIDLGRVAALGNIALEVAAL